ncbi:MAG: cob(I)yrinic acid a,c-diamide adenosyltransferase, partial [Planctomycetaceae bacterium]|nr:cob(I)yrinic acid a,c-diamide adenosyltransferase [Planctomycetaceae bacterium]
MVYLHRIYTRSGDEGETALGDGRRVPKDHCRIVAYGTVDELNSSLGVVVAGGLLAPLASQLERIQHDLFDVGADLCVPQTAGEQPGARLRVDAVAVTRLEQWIDEATAELAPLESFILPGGSPQAAGLHMARTICRRAEIEVLRLARGEDINP